MLSRALDTASGRLLCRKGKVAGVEAAFIAGSLIFNPSVFCSAQHNIKGWEVEVKDQCQAGSHQTKVNVLTPSFGTGLP